MQTHILQNWHIYATIFVFPSGEVTPGVLTTFLGPALTIVTVTASPMYLWVPEDQISMPHSPAVIFLMLRDGEFLINKSMM